MQTMVQNGFRDDSQHQRSALLREKIRLVKREDCGRYEIAPIPESQSFDKGFFVMIRACQLLVQSNEGIIFVGVAGPSGSGKTVFTEKVLSVMPGIAVLSMDNYNDASRIIDGNFDDPRLTDYDTLLENIQGLREGRPVQVPIYDFKTSSRTGYRMVEVPSSRLVIIEGIYALNERLRPMLDLRVSVTGGVHFDLVKRVMRDIQCAGQEPEEIIQQISETVYPMYKAFIEPDLKIAHIKIANKFNPFTGFQNPTFILKSPRTLTVDEIKAVISKEHTEKVEETLDIYLLPPGEDHEACQSYLRMRSRDGKYNLIFEEWVTDKPFIILPRISFEVSVRLLGGLMALGYTIASSLKRSSHIFYDDKVVVKIDWLEQLDRQYVQVQGKDRQIVKHTAEQLGLDGSYVPHTYIEQIQLEKIVKEVMALPDDLKVKLSRNEELASSPSEALSRVSADLVTMRNNHLRSGMSHSYSEQEYRHLSSLPPVRSKSKRFEGRDFESPAPNKGLIKQLSKQMTTIDEKMDMFTFQFEELNSKLDMSLSSLEDPTLEKETCNGSACTSGFLFGLENGALLPNSSSNLQLAKESPLIEEIMVLARCQRQIMHQLDNLSNLVHERLDESTPVSSSESKSKNLCYDVISSPLFVTLVVGGFSIFLFKVCYRN